MKPTAVKHLVNYQMPDPDNFFISDLSETSTIDLYQIWVSKMWKRQDGEGHKPPKLKLDDYYVMSTGLGGETGEVLELLKKSIRDKYLDKTDLKKELGDVLFYLNMICNYHGFRVADVMGANIKKLVARNKRKKKKSKKSKKF